MRPMPDRYLALWSESFAAALQSIDQPDEEQARAAVAEAEEAAWQALRSFAAQTLVSEARSLARQREDEQHRREQAAARAAETAREGMAHLEKVFGKDIAKQVDPWANYQLIGAAVVDDDSGPRLYLAVPDSQAEAVVEALFRRFGEDRSEMYTGRAGKGYELGRLARGTVQRPLDGSVDAVVDGDDAAAKAVELVGAELAKGAEAAKRERMRDARAAADARARDERIRTFGRTK
jgi:hypothetical protein